MIYFICGEFTDVHEKWCKENNCKPFYVKPYSLCNFKLEDTVLGKDIELTKSVYYLGPCNVDEEACDYGFLINDTLKPDSEVLNIIEYQHNKVPFDENDRNTLKFLSFKREYDLYEYLLSLIKLYQSI